MVELKIRQILGIGFLGGALFLTLLTLMDSGSHLGPGFPEEDKPSGLLIAAIITAIVGMILLFGSRLEQLKKVAK